MADSSTSGVVSNLQIMRALLAKDWRLFRAPMIALAVVGAGCYLIGVAEIFYWPSDNRATIAFFNSSVIACDLTSLLASAFGGIAIAGERSDRTADFLGLLPVTRGQIILSKWLVSILMVGAFAMFFAIVAGLFWQRQSYPPGLGLAASWAMPAAAWLCCTTCFFGVAWLLSSFTRSGPISACVSIATTLAALFLAAVSQEFSAVPESASMAAWNFLFQLGWPPLAVGLVSLIAGTLYYLRRVAP